MALISLDSESTTPARILILKLVSCQREVSQPEVRRRNNNVVRLNVREACEQGSFKHGGEMHDDTLSERVLEDGFSKRKGQNRGFFGARTLSDVKKSFLKRKRYK